MKKYVIKRGLTLFTISTLLILSFSVSSTNNAQKESKIITTSYTFSQPSTDISVDVKLNLVDVIVTDKDSNTVDDLKPEDFTLYHGGEKQPLDKVTRMVSIDQAPVRKQLENTESTVETQEPAKEETATTTKYLPNNYMLLFYNLPPYPERRRKIFDAAANFIDNECNPEDQIAMFHLNPYGYQLIQYFRKDKDGTRKRMYDYIDSGELKKQRVDNLLRDSALAQDFVYQLYNNAGMSQGGMLGGQNVTDFNFLADNLKETYQRQTNAYFRQTMVNIRLLSYLMRELEGRKNVVLITDGLPATLKVDQATPSGSGLGWSVSPSVHKWMQELAFSFNQHNIALYTIDTSRAPTGAHDITTRYDSSIDGSGYSADTIGAEETRVGFLRQVADVTGGRFFNYVGTGEEKLESAFKNIRNDSKSYYILGYIPPKTQEPGENYEVEVEVNREDLTVSYRKTVGEPALYTDKDEVNRQIELIESLISDKVFNELTLTGDVRFFPSSSDLTMSLMAVEAEFPEVIHGDEASMLMSCVLYTAQDKVFSEYHENIDVDFKKDDIDKATKKLRYFQFMITPPGKYRIKFFIADRITGKKASMTRIIEIPNLKTSGGAFSSILPMINPDLVLGVSDYAPLPGREEIKIDPDNPLFLDGKILTYSLQKEVKEKSFAAFIVVDQEKSGIFGEDISWFARRIDNVDPESEPKMIEAELKASVPHKNNTVGYSFELPLKLSIGEYELVARARNQAGLVLESRLPIKIVP